MVDVLKCPLCNRPMVSINDSSTRKVAEHFFSFHTGKSADAICCGEAWKSWDKWYKHWRELGAEFHYNDYLMGVSHEAGR